MTRFQKFFAFLLVLICTSLTLAAVSQVGYKRFLTTTSPTKSHFSVAAVDTANSLDTPAAALETLGNPNVAVSATFSDAGATVGVTLHFYHKTGSTYTWLAKSAETTITAVSTETTTATTVARYPGTVLTDDTMGCNAVDVRISTAVSAGDVELTPWVYGVKTLGIE